MVSSILFSSHFIDPKTESEYNQAVVSRLASQYTQRSTLFENLRKNDYRYRDIQESQKSYLQIISQENFDPADLEKSLGLLNHPYFIHLKKPIQSGIPEAIVGYKVLRPGFLLPPEQSTLLRLNHDKQMTLSILASFYNPETGKINITPKTNSEKIVVDKLFQSDFIKKLISLHAQGLLTDGQLLFRMQEDVEWTTKFKECNTMNIVRLTANENGEFTETPLTLQNIQAETLMEIFQ